MSGAVKVDIALPQIMRDGYFSIVPVQPQQAELLAIYAREMPRPVHDDRIFMNYWHDSEAPGTVLKVHVHNINKRLIALDLMLRRSHDFGYMLTDCADYTAAFTQATAEAIIEACRHG